MSTIKKRSMYIFLTVIIFIIGMFAGCGGSGTKTSEAPHSTAMSNKSESSMAGSAATGLDNSNRNGAAEQSQATTNSQAQTNSPVPDSKIIKNGTMDMETKDFTNTVNKVMDKAAECGGYVESSNITGTSINDQRTYQNRSANLKLRIPQQYFTKFLTDAGTIGNVIRSSTSSENVTYQYYDTQAHVKALSTEEDRLLELLKKTGELKDILELEKELANVRYQIENLTGTLKKMDNLVDYSTVQVTINEVQEIQSNKKAPVTLWDKVSSGFIESVKFMVSIFKDILIGAAYALPFIALAAIVFLVVKRLDLIKKFKKDNKTDNK